MKNEELKIKEFEEWFKSEFDGTKEIAFQKTKNPKSNADLYISDIITIAYACWNKLIAPAERWVSCEERLPEPKKEGVKADRYFVNYAPGYGENEILYYFYEEQQWTKGDGGTQKGITHWQPLPQPPADGKGEE